MHFPLLFPLMTVASRLGRIIGLLTIAIALAACSAIKLGYNNLDSITYWWLESYIDFNDQQASQVREDIARLYLWHRAKELPRIAQLLHGMEELAPADLDAAQACYFVGQLRHRLEALVDRAEPALVTLAMSLTPGQLQHLSRVYQKINAKYRKEWIAPTASERLDKRFELFLERSEMIYGRLDESQRVVLRRFVEHSIFDASRLLAERERQQEDALQTLRKLTNSTVASDEARNLMHSYLSRIQESPDTAYRAYQESLIDEGCRNFAALHNSTTAAQRDIAVRRLRAYQRDLRELASGQ
jgi:Family of unknown function (DUF6279)